MVIIWDGPLPHLKSWTFEKLHIWKDELWKTQTFEKSHFWKVALLKVALLKSWSFKKLQFWRLALLKSFKKSNFGKIKLWKENYFFRQKQRPTSDVNISETGCLIYMKLYQFSVHIYVQNLWNFNVNQANHFREIDVGSMPYTSAVRRRSVWPYRTISSCTVRLTVRYGSEIQSTKIINILKGQGSQTNCLGWATLGVQVSWPRAFSSHK